jgi:hypothetical protein
MHSGSTAPCTAAPCTAAPCTLLHPRTLGGPLVCTLSHPRTLGGPLARGSTPLIAVLSSLDDLVASAPGVAEYVKGAFGSATAARQAILTDFFRHAFDGSGADNFYDAGSCIDGRLTSAWNWCAGLDLT